ncbi:MAG: DUF2237 family protein [Gammaproteobacteria bacterium]|jgi:uncharacterized protein (DUF2237 family)
MDQLNVFGEPLELCCDNPITGFTRDGFCNHHPMDRGLHTVCAQMTSEFLNFSKEQGNDLSTPIPEFNFPGLNEGDRWCLCAMRWVEAYEHGKAPKIYLRDSHQQILDLVEIEILRKYALDLN